MGQIPCPGNRRGVLRAFPVTPGCARCRCVTFTECRHWHLRKVSLASHFILPSKQNTQRGRPRWSCTWLTLLVLATWRVVDGVNRSWVWLVFGFVFIFESRVIASSPVLGPHSEAGERCIAVCKLFYYFFIIIIKGLPLSPHHCEITELNEMFIAQVVHCFRAVLVSGGGPGSGAEGPPRSCESLGHCTFFQKPQRMEASSSLSFPGMSLFLVTTLQLEFPLDLG